MQIRRLPGPFGAAVEQLRRGSSCSMRSHATARRRIVRAPDPPASWNNRLTEAEYARFGRIWGDPLLFFVPQHRHGAFPEIIKIRNSPATPPESRDGAMHWHSDSSYEEVPASVTMLYGVEAPDTGNDTLFADLAAAYDSLPAATKEVIEPLQVIHDPRGGKVNLPGEVRGSGTTEPLPVVSHPLVMRHPVTGRKALFGISGTACGIVGWEEARGHRPAARAETTRAAAAVSAACPGRQGHDPDLGQFRGDALRDSDRLQRRRRRRRLLHRISTKGLPPVCRHDLAVRRAGAHRRPEVSAVRTFRGGRRRASRHPGRPARRRDERLLLRCGRSTGAVFAAPRRIGRLERAGARPSWLRGLCDLPEPDGRLSVQADIVFSALDQFGTKRTLGAGICLVGHSYGFKLALTLAAHERGRELLGVEGSGAARRYRPERTQDVAHESEKMDRETAFRLFWGSRDLYPPDTFRYVRDVVETVPAAENREAPTWPDVFDSVAAQIHIPVRVTMAEHETWWITGPEELQAIAAAFTAAPVVETAVQPGAGHNISLGWAARSYHLECSHLLSGACCGRACPKTSASFEVAAADESNRLIRQDGLAALVDDGVAGSDHSPASGLRRPRLGHFDDYRNRVADVHGCRDVKVAVHEGDPGAIEHIGL